MNNISKLLLATSLFCMGVANAKQPAENFETQVQKLFASHFHKYKDQEYYSGATLSIYIPNQNIKNLYIGQVSHDPKSKRISAETLFHIGSISKSFTGVLTLLLEKDGKLKLHDTLDHWYPNYKIWSGISIKHLLNMTSCIPNYSDSAAWASIEMKNMQRVWSNTELVNFAIPNQFNPPLKSGYFYSNTSYILAGMIIEKASKQTYEHELINRILKPTQLLNTYYPIPKMSVDIQERLAHGYSYNQYDVPSFVGTDVHNNNLSWAAAAGGIVSNSEDIIKWVKSIFIDDKLLNAEQKKSLKQLISMRTGKSIPFTSKNDTAGFGLGVAQIYQPYENIGRLWAYKGQTLGFRASYLYKECNGVIVSGIINSSTNAENDHLDELLKNVYKIILSNYPQLKCNDKI